MKRIRLLLMFAGLLAGCTGREQPDSQIAPVAGITVADVELSSDDGPIRGKVARVNLADPTVHVVVTAPLKDATAPVESRLLPTDTWAAELYAAQSSTVTPQAMLAVNANFFGIIGGSKDYRIGVDSDIVGLSLSRGVVVSPPREINGLGDPALLFDRDADGGLRARISRVTDTDLAGAECGVAGIGSSHTSKTTGPPLLTAGFATAHESPVAAEVRYPRTAVGRHPRTAAGVADGGKTLVLVTIDGRQSDWSVGMTLPELAKLMLNQGCTDAVNLDGGGSTAFLFYDADGKLMTNRPSDGKFRPVANHLGVIWMGAK